MKEFSEWIKDNLKVKGWTRRDLAQRLKMSEAGVSKIINLSPHSVTGAIPKTPVETVDRIADAFGQPKEVAREKAGYMLPATQQTEPEKLRLLLMFDGLPYQQKQDALALVETLWRRHARTEPITELDGEQIDDMTPIGRASRTETENRRIMNPHLEPRFTPDTHGSEESQPPANPRPADSIPRRKNK